MLSIQEISESIKNDVFRLYRVVSPDTRVEMPKQVGVDMSRFLSAMETEHIDLKVLGYRGDTVEQVLAGLKIIYGVDG